MGDVGRPLGITAVTTGKILERLGYRGDKRVTDSAFAAGCGVRRRDGYAMYDDWHLDRALAAIRSAAEVPGNPEVADALRTAIAKQERKARVTARKREQEQTEAAHQQEEEAVMSALQVELRALGDTDAGMSLLTAVEFISPDLAQRIALYRRCHAEDQSIGAAKDLGLLERRAKAEGFQV
jgi:hypothetical protein